MTNGLRFLLFTLLLSFVLPLAVNAQRFTPVDDKSSVEFSVGRHKFGYHVIKGTMKGLKGEITFDPGNLAQSFFNVSVADSTVRSGNDQRDHDLKGENWLNSKKYPYITFLSTKMEKSNTNGLYILNGDLSIRGVTLPVVIALKAVPSRDGDGYTFSGFIHIHRLDYGLGEPGNTDDEMLISISLFAAKQ